MAKRRRSRESKSARDRKARLERRLHKERGLARADLSIAAAATRAGRKPAIRPLTDLGELAAQPPLMGGALLVVLIGALRDDKRLRRSGLRMLLAVALATAAAKAGKKAIGRTRPSRLVDAGSYAFRAGHPEGQPEDEWESFPSAHSAGGFAAARALGRDYPGLAPPSLSAAVMAGGLKVLKGDHFPSDVIVGLALGYLAELAAAAIVPGTEMRNDPQSGGAR